MLPSRDQDQQPLPPPHGRPQVQEALLLQARRVQLPVGQSASPQRSLQRAPGRTSTASRQAAAGKRFRARKNFYLRVSRVRKGKGSQCYKILNMSKTKRAFSSD